MTSSRHPPPPISRPVPARAAPGAPPPACGCGIRHAPPPAAAMRPPTAGPLLAGTLQGYFPAGRPVLPAGGLILQPMGVHTAQAGGNVMRLPSSFTLPGHGGQPLPDALRNQMEQLFRTSFADVRVHVGPEAGAIGSQAFTVGSRIYFAPGHYHPDHPRGRHLLGHELTHVVQQKAGRVRHPTGQGLVVVQDRALEVEAEMMGVRAAMNAGAAPLVVQPAGWSGSRVLQAMEDENDGPRYNFRKKVQQAQEERINKEKLKFTLGNLNRQQRAEKFEAIKLGKKYIPEGFENIELPMGMGKYDKFGNKLFQGYRKECGWKKNYYEWAKDKIYYNKKCANGTEVCSGGWQLDHLTSFYPCVDELCRKYITCDGNGHWLTYILEWDGEAEELNQAKEVKPDTKHSSSSVIRAYHMTANHEWKCRYHNGSKSGEERDGTMLPKMLAKCPGLGCQIIAPVRETSY
jgi:hypothetical protein